MSNPYPNQYDNSLIQIFLPFINAGLIAEGFVDVSVKQSAQPTMQGINTNPTVYFFKYHMKRYGYPGRINKWDDDLEVMTKTEIQYYENTFQVSALVTQNPLTPNQYTAADLIDEVCSILQSSDAVKYFNDNGIGILRIGDISNPYFKDDHDNFLAHPTFDFTLLYQNDRVSSTPIISEYDYKIIGV